MVFATIPSHRIERKTHRCAIIDEHQDFHCKTYFGVRDGSNLTFHFCVSGKVKRGLLGTISTGVEFKGCYEEKARKHFCIVSTTQLHACSTHTA